MNKEAKQKEIKKAGAEDDVLVVKEVIHIEDGKHKGHITNVIRENKKGFDYIDVYIELDDIEGSIKTGFPSGISDVSSFGRLLKSAGIDFVAGDEISLTEIKHRLIGRSLTFQTYTENDFANVMNKTIKFED